MHLEQRQSLAQSASQSAGGGGPASFFSVSKFNFGKWSGEGGREGSDRGDEEEEEEGDTSGGSSAKKRNPTICRAYHHALLTPIRRGPQKWKTSGGGREDKKALKFEKLESN